MVCCIYSQVTSRLRRARTRLICACFLRTVPQLPPDAVLHSLSGSVIGAALLLCSVLPKRCPLLPKTHLDQLRVVVLELAPGPDRSLVTALRRRRVLAHFGAAHSALAAWAPSPDPLLEKIPANRPPGVTFSLCLLFQVYHTCSQTQGTRMTFSSREAPLCSPPAPLR